MVFCLLSGGHMLCCPGAVAFRALDVTQRQDRNQAVERGSDQRMERSNCLILCSTFGPLPLVLLQLQATLRSNLRPFPCLFCFVCVIFLHGACFVLPIVLR